MADTDALKTAKQALVIAKDGIATKRRLDRDLGREVSLHLFDAEVLIIRTLKALDSIEEQIRTEERERAAKIANTEGDKYVFSGGGHGAPRVIGYEGRRTKLARTIAAKILTPIPAKEET